jgi:uncharacterized protein YecE (DUF72 family)
MAAGRAAAVAPVLTGTMGWSYEDWRGPFYEAGLPAAKMLEQLAKVFPTVELDTTFYGVPRPTTLQQWAAAVPDGFVFSAKAPRAITHERRLVGAVEAATDFGGLLRRELGDKLGALLLQLPPDFTEADRRILETFADGLASSRTEAGQPWVAEFRHESWKDTDIADWLAARGILTATTEKFDLGTPLRYLRLLGSEGAVARFDERQFDRADEIAGWAARLDAARREDPAAGILVYVRNFFEGHAPATIADLRARLGLPNATPPGQQQMSLF